MKNTGSHNGYLRFEHEANGGKKLWIITKSKKLHRIMKQI